MQQVLTESAKGLAVLNGGGALAMLGLLQALVQKVLQFGLFKPYGLSALAAFVVGALMAALTFYCRWIRSTWMLVDDTTRQRSFWLGATVGLVWATIAAFVVGCVLGHATIPRNDRRRLWAVPLNGLKVPSKDRMSSRTMRSLMSRGMTDTLGLSGPSAIPASSEGGMHRSLSSSIQRSSIDGTVPALASRIAFSIEP
ncbi:hypothetical protein P3W85_36850 [Cupriavidus basilensis]|uniref:Transmembrane protein n=1 Tax=Cupriavidus basilensis TaxID=68895 RepID=A0ABT6B0S5_9BURK|nr:hypothetical protein [Cupriavidus basilensis]MDF3838463.1 hypothetical protein [Cupriavidus basilensis]